jgi:hypothetical protein
LAFCLSTRNDSEFIMMGLVIALWWNWVVPEKIHTPPPPRRKFLPSGGGGEKKLFLIIVNVLGHPKRVGGLTSYFLRGGGVDVFWNDPFK